MATKNISITEEAYKRLAALRKRNESFSEIILEVTGKKSKLKDFFGVLSKEAGEELEKSIIEGRIRHSLQHKKRIERIGRELSE